MERKFKVGDKVRFIGDASKHTSSDALICHKDELTVHGICDNGDIRVMWSSNGPYRYYTWVMTTNEIELIEFTKDSLQPGDMVTLRNGARLILDEDTEFWDITNINNYITDIDDFTDELSFKPKSYYAYDQENNDIVKVERPTYHTVYERVEEKKEPKKMTVAEISKKLGYDVEIVKG